MDGPVPVVVKAAQVWKSLAFGALVAGSISVGAMAQSAAGQIGGGIPCALTNQAKFTPNEELQIQNFVAAAAANLPNPNPAIAQQARDDLFTPLGCNGVGVSFRLKYGGALNKELSPLVNANQSPQVVIKALLIMGRVRASESVRILATGLADPRPVVRFGASVGYRELLRKPRGEIWPLNRGQRNRVLTDLQRALGNENDAMVVHGLVLALTSVQDEAMQTDAMTRLARGLASRRSTLPPDDGDAGALKAWVRAYSLALLEVRGLLLNPPRAGGAGGARTLALEASIFAGQSLALVRDLMDHPALQGDVVAQIQLRNIASMSDAVMAFAGPALGQAVHPLGLPRAFDQGKAVFEQAIESWIGPQGLLTKAPYNANPTDFD